MRIFALFGRPSFLRTFHGIASIVWLLIGLAVVFAPFARPLQKSVAFLVFVSIYANLMGHWSSWQAARVEVKQDEQNGDSS